MKPVTFESPPEGKRKTTDGYRRKSSLLFPDAIRKCLRFAVFVRLAMFPMVVHATIASNNHRAWQQGRILTILKDHEGLHSGREVDSGCDCDS